MFFAAMEATENIPSTRAAASWHQGVSYAVVLLLLD